MIMNGDWAQKWTEIKPLGGGGQGDTLLVQSNSEPTKKAVLKLLKPHKAKDPKARRRMFQEVANLKILKNAGGKVPEILDGNTEMFADIEAPLFFVMEFIPGQMLADIVLASRNLSVDQSLAIALDLCATLRVAVKEGIVHRDIKPENIITRSIAPADVVMVDFGLSFNEDVDPTNTSVDEGIDNKFISLPERRGPGENKRDPRSDITDVCAILFYCLTGCSPRNLQDSQGRLPHRRPNYELSNRIQEPSLLGKLNSLLDRGLNYELDSRFQTIEQLVTRLDEIANPASKQKIEDLDVVAARETATLRKQDRRTQLTIYYNNTAPLQQSLAQCVNEIQGRLQKYNSFSFQFINNLSRETGKADKGDYLAMFGFMTAVQQHDLRLHIYYKIFAVGSECTVYREILEFFPGKGSKPIESLTVVARYQGVNEIDRAAIVADIRETVSRTIEMLSQRVLNP